tara:strand:- start:2360 stop:3133 length:774 start_codon:yes stop_codon:yes gene_type:complete
MAKHIINEQGQGFNCEGTCECITPVFGTGQYQTETDCINDTNCCKRWKCDPNGAGVCEAVNDMSAPYETETDCLASNPNGCQPVGPEICCDVWVCVGSGTNSECCKSLELCKPQGASMDTNYPNGFPWNLVESSSVPPKEFNRILNENLILEWTCNMNWSAHFGIWLGATKQECLDGPSWGGVGPASGQGPCGPCASTPIKTKYFDKFDKEFVKKDTERMIDNWKKEGKVRRLDENFYNNIISLVEDVYHTQKLLKG